MNLGDFKYQFAEFWSEFKKSVLALWALQY